MSEKVLLAPEDLETVRQRTRLAIQVLERIAGLKSKAEDRVDVTVDPKTGTAEILAQDDPSLVPIFNPLQKGSLRYRWGLIKIFDDRLREKVRRTIANLPRTIGDQIHFPLARDFLLRTADELRMNKEYQMSINPANINNGTAYFAEASHLVRDVALKEQMQRQKYQFDDKQIGEFYDMAGQRIGFELWKGSPELKRRLGNTLYKKARKAFRGCFSYKDDVQGFTRPDPEMRMRQANDLNQLRAVKMRKVDKEYASKIDEIFSKYPATTSTDEQLDEREKKLKEAEKKCVEELTKQEQAKRELSSHLLHRKPYAAAELFPVQAYLAPGFYQMQDKEVRARYISPATLIERARSSQLARERQSQRKGALEQTAEAALYLILPMFLVYLFFNIQLTGFSFLDTLTSLTINPLALALAVIILFLISLKVCLRSKRKEIN